MNNEIYKVVKAMKQVLKDDSDCARCWHDNIACMVMDSDISHKTANKIASRCMLALFDVKTGQHIKEHYVEKNL